MLGSEKTKMKMTKDKITETLRNNVKVVTFTKADGTERVMKCTLMPEHLPEQVSVPEPGVEHAVRKQNDNVCSVWDIEKEGWRSFRVDSVKMVE